MIKPKCFTWEQWQIYHRLGGRSYSICSDCLPDYQQEMKDAGLCERPEATFHRVGNRYIFDHNGPDQIDK